MPEVTTPDAFEVAADQVQRALNPLDLFGPDADEARRTYRRLARATHPDVAPDPDKGRVVTALLNVLWDRYKKGLSGTFEIATKHHTYTIEALLAADEISNIYPCSWEQDGDERYGVMRMPRSPKNNDLVASEASALRKLDDADDRFRMYAPTLVETFRHRDAATKVDRRVNVTERIEGFVTLAEVQKAFPGGLDGRDAAWIWRRLLAGAGWFHRAGLVNGAILPEHVIVHPIKHGVVFANWCYATEIGQPLRAISAAHAGWYPESVAAKKPSTAQVDIHLVAKLMEWLLGPNAPKQFRAFVKGCTLPFGALPDAWEVQREFDDLLMRLYGARKYRPLMMPA